MGKVDVLVGLYHGGFERDLETGKPRERTDENIGWRLCEELPFDILLTGHQHIPMANRVIHGTHVAQTPGNATAYVKLDGGRRGARSRPGCARRTRRPN